MLLQANNYTKIKHDKDFREKDAWWYGHTVSLKTGLFYFCIIPLREKLTFKLHANEPLNYGRKREQKERYFSRINSKLKKEIRGQKWYAAVTDKKRWQHNKTICQFSLQSLHYNVYAELRFKFAALISTLLSSNSAVIFLVQRLFGLMGSIMFGSVF